MNSLLAEHDIQQAQCTYIIHIHMQYTEQHSEFFLSDEANTSFAVEDLAGQILSTMFDFTMIDEVIITNPVEGTAQELPHHAFHLYVRCLHSTFPSGPDEIKMMEYALEQKLGCAFLQLFDILEIEQVDVRFIPAEQE